MRKQSVEELTAVVDERLTAVQAEISQVREEVARKLERLDAWLITRDPSTRVAAEAYDGLRRQLSAGAKARRMHLVDLAKLDLLVRKFEARIDADGTTTARELLDSLREHAAEWASDAGMETISALTPETRGHFEMVEEVEGVGDVTDGAPGGHRVLKPAYVDRSDGTAILIRRGVARPSSAAASQELTPLDGEARDLGASPRPGHDPSDEVANGRSGAADDEGGSL